MRPCLLRATLSVEARLTRVYSRQRVGCWQDPLPLTRPHALPPLPPPADPTPARPPRLRNLHFLTRQGETLIIPQ